jgi:ATP-dependent Lon protease
VSETSAPETPTDLDGDIIQDVETVDLPEVLPVLPLRGHVLFPIMLLPLGITEESSIQLVDDALAADRFVVLATQREGEEEAEGAAGVYDVGTAATIVRMSRGPDGGMRLLVQGIRRVRLTSFEQEEPYLTARAETLEEIPGSGTELEALRRGVIDLFRTLVSRVPQAPPEVMAAVEGIDEPGRLADFAASNLSMPVDRKQAILAEPSVEERLRELVTVLTREVEVLEIGSEIQEKVKSSMDKRGREAFLREQLKAIQDELGEGDAQSAEVDELRERIEAAGLPEEARKVADHELDRLARMHPAAAEYNVSRTWLDWLASLPWAKETEDRLDVAEARKILDEDHFDLEKVKDRILEYLSVLKLQSDLRGPILCFAGPPGVGKTSLGRSIARSIGREFVRIALGGVRDEAEIRGHRRTYIGALPGRIIQSVKKAGRRNPLFMLDEIDKLGQDFRGDPSSALLEVLDPEQNGTFADHYLEVPFDLSRVMFITTANVLAAIPEPLRDRMEVIQLPGYTDKEKIGIARRHLAPKQAKLHGLEAGLVSWEDEAFQAVVRGYTREAGVRNLEREVAAVLRKIARRVAEGSKDPVTVDAALVRELLGPERYFDEVAERTCVPGVATGLAWTAAGGDVLFVEATRMRGKKGLTVTGSLGDVMKESVQAALSLVRSQAETIGIEPDFFERSDLHVHVPAGAIPKDGPSAGVTMTVALSSLLTGRAVRSDTAMTGEITLRGRVLPVGGIKEKVLAAHRAGIRRVLLPAKNEKDIEDVPVEVRDEMEFHFVAEFEEAIALALRGADEGCDE